MKKIIIDKEQAGRRIDKFLSVEFFSYTRGEIIKNIKNESILINGKKIKPSYILKENDTIKINFKKIVKELTPNQDIKFEIIYQDKNIAIINKPAGLKVHPISLKEKDTLVNGLLAKFPEIENVNDKSPGSELRPGIVHRLDQDTSGIMVVARNQKSFDELKELFQARKMTKKYLAVVYGKLKNKKGIVDKPLAKSSSYKKQTIASGKTKTKIHPAITEYAVLKEFSDYSLVEARPKTGRTHQIRIHLFSLGHPIVGDKKYKLKKTSTLDRPERQLLHAQSLEFELFGKKYQFIAKLPHDFEDFLTKIQ